MSSPIPVLQNPEGPYTQSRIGVVTLATPNSMFVDVGGTVIEVAFIQPFVTATVAPPPAGTVVQLIRQDASWIAVGKVVGTGSNSVQNPSFELSAPGSQPVTWQVANVSGASTATVVDILGAPDGDFAAQVYSAQTSLHYLYSAPIAVNTGETWSLSAFVGGDYNGGPQTADSGIDALWFANSTDLFPTVSAPSTVVATSVDVPQYPPFRTMSGSVVVPAATFFMRVALRSSLVAGQSLIYDHVTARRV